MKLLLELTKEEIVKAVMPNLKGDVEDVEIIIVQKDKKEENKTENKITAPLNSNPKTPMSYEERRKMEYDRQINNPFYKIMIKKGFKNFKELEKVSGISDATIARIAHGYRVADSTLLKLGVVMKLTELQLKEIKEYCNEPMDWSKKS